MNKEEVIPKTFEFTNEIQAKIVALLLVDPYSLGIASKRFRPSSLMILSTSGL